MIEERQRNVYLDLVKGTAICLVVLGHCIQFGSGAKYLETGAFFENTIFRVIYSFHMPVFMMISGYLFSYSIRKYSFVELIKTRIMHLLVPIFLWGTIDYVVKNMKEMMNFSMSGWIHNILYSLWFLWAIWYCSIVIIVVNKWLNDSALIYLFGWILTFVIPDTYNLHLYKYMYPFFIVSYLAGKKCCAIKQTLTLRTISKITVIIFLVWLLLLRFFHYETYIYTSGYNILEQSFSIKQLGIDIYRMIIGFAGGISFLGTIYITYMKISFCKAAAKILAYLGKIAFGIYVVSSYLFNEFFGYITRNFSQNYILNLIEMVIVLSIAVFCVQILMKIPTLRRLLLGGK